jgi:hypothetical protein
MNNEFLKNIITKSTEQKMQKVAAEKRKKYFQNIGRKGGLKKKNNSQLGKIISFRLTDLEYEESLKKAQKINLKLSAFARMVHLEKELKIKEFETEKVLLEYGNNFIRIKNLLRHREWNVFKNKSEIIKEIELVLQLMREYLELRMDKMKNND